VISNCVADPCVAVVSVPVNAMEKPEGAPSVVAEMTKLPERLPPAVGVKTTLTVQELFFGNVWGQLFVCEKSAELTPSTVTLLINRLKLFLDDTVMLCEGLGTNTGWTAKARDVRDTDWANAVCGKKEHSRPSPSTAGTSPRRRPSIV